MKTLFLLRHAKSSWDDPGCADFDRPLNNRGRKAAGAIGVYMKEKNLVPDLVLSSSSARTRETMERFVEGFEAAPEVKFLDDLYLASAGTIISFARKTLARINSLMIVGHNPGLHQLALSLAGTGARRDIDNLSAKYPTGSLLEITFPVDAWVDIGPGGGRLVRFIKPRGL